MRRSLCILLLVSAFTAACGDDEDDPPTTTPSTTQTTREATPTTVPATVAQRVTDGAVCTSPGARGTTEAGLPMVCTQIAGGSETRWRPA